MLKEYRLGECLGRGAFGSVYKAIHWGTGEAVAVKQIKLGNVPKSELKMIAAEIELLKNLKHDNIVKYLGFAKSEACLNIILEYCENGSLHSICKNYGKFPENLVGLYMTQVLQGLLYLHDQGVIHRDIKGANILTTKDGKVKLADFGVSTRTLSGEDKEDKVFGTAFWMAPEVIQLSGATTASDIWSLGSTVIELLEGNPPYYHMPQMAAMYAIVNDDHPTLPQGVSRACRDFLLQCFQKDPNIRVSARRLLKHPWITSSRRKDDPVHKAPANYNEAVEEVKQWNEALRSPDTVSVRVATQTSGHQIKCDAPLKNIHNENKVTPPTNQIGSTKPKSSAELFRSSDNEGDDNWDDDFPNPISPSGLRLPQLKAQDNFGGLLSSDNLKAYASSVDLSLTAKDTINWDANFDFKTIRAAPMKLVGVDATEVATIRAPSRKTSGKMGKPAQIKSSDSKMSQPPIKSPRLMRKAQHADDMTAPAFPALKSQAKSTEDFSMFLDDESVFDRPLQLLRRGNVLSPKSLDMGAVISDLQKKAAPLNGDKRSFPKRTPSSLEIQKYAENEGDGDYADIVSDTASEDGPLRFVQNPPKSAWPEDEDDEDDPFASLEQGFDEFDLQANIARDKHARMCANIESLVGSLKATQSEDMLFEVSEQMLDMLFESPDSKELIMRAHGLIPILEVLDECTVKSYAAIVLQLLRIINALISNDVEVQQHLCNAGGIPIMTKFAETKFPNDIRLEAAAFVRQMYQTSATTLQLLICAGGLNVLIDFLKEDYDEAKDLVLIGVNGIWNVFELQTTTPKNDFCRIFSRSKILSSLSEILNRALDDKPAIHDKTAKNKLIEQIEGRIVSIFYYFSNVENHVKEAVADRMVLKRVLKDLHRLSPQNRVVMLRFIKNLSMLSTTLDAIHSSNAMELLIRLVEEGGEGQPQFREICNQVLIIMFNLCRLNKARQEDAAREGIIPLLLRMLKVKDPKPPKELILPILCDMAHAGRTAMKYLWQNNGLEFYISLLRDHLRQVTALDAIYAWHQEETAKVEQHLLEGNFSNAIVDCFNNEDVDFNLLETLHKLLRLSPAVAATLVRPKMFSALGKMLSAKKPDIRLNLLRLVCSICDPEQGSPSTLRRSGLLETIESLAQNDPTVLIKNMASEFVKTCMEKEENESSGGSRRAASVFRRSSPYNLSAEQSSPSAPVTPTHKSRTSRQGGAILGSPLTPQRRPMTPRDILDESLLSPPYRERPRENNFMLRRPSIDPETLIEPNRLSGDTTISNFRRPSGDAGGTPGKSRLPRTAALKTSRASAASLSTDSPKVQQPSSSARKEREPNNRSRGDTKSIDSGRPLVPLGEISRRRTKRTAGQDVR